jgi:two-component system sensor histidine kinase KdpD
VKTARESSARHRPRLSYRRQQMLSLLLLATIPLAVFSLVALQRIAYVSTADGNDRASNAAEAVRTILSRDSSDLRSLLSSYVTWSRLRSATAALDTIDIAGTVIDFQVARGTVDVAVLTVGDTTVAGGNAAIVTALETILVRAPAPTPGADDGLVSVAYADLGDGVYEVATGPIDLSGLTGPGLDATAERPAALAFASRLDSAFVVHAQQLTGFDVAVYDRTGDLLVASDLELAARAGRPDLAALPASGDTVARPPTGLVAAGFSVIGADGNRVGAVLAMTDLNLLGAIYTGLMPFLVLILALTLVLAVSLSVVLSAGLRTRLEAIRAGIAAVARGDLTAPLPEGDRDEIERLAGSHNRLAAILERRDRMIWDSAEAIEQLRPELGADRLGADGVEAARRIFGLEASWLRTADGQVIAVAPLDASLSPEPTIRTLLPPVDSDLRLEGRIADPLAWSAADHTLFELYAREFGAALRNAGLFANATSRVERLDRVNRLQQDFLAAIGHNLRSPLTRILMASDDLRSFPRPDAATRTQAGAIHADAERLSRVVGQLLTLSRLDAGAYSPTAEVLELVPVIRRAWEALASDRAFEIVDRSATAVAIGDRSAVEQILWILLDNAITHAPSGPVRVTIDSRAAWQRGRVAAGAELVVGVADQGPGVAPEDRSRIFGRFQQGSGVGTSEGTGLGLDVARGLVRAMGGQVWLEVNDAPGATFAFSLPAETVDGPV